MMKWRSPLRPCEQPYLNLRNHRWVPVPNPSPALRQASGLKNPATRQIGVGSPIVSLITNRVGTSEFYVAFPASPGFMASSILVTRRSACFSNLFCRVS